ncbi:MAG TPA: hypothetical protein VIN38_06965 [Thiobacillus sp.]
MLRTIDVTASGQSPVVKSGEREFRMVASEDATYHAHVDHADTHTRMSAALAYFVAAWFFAGIVNILANSWGKEGFDLLLTPGNPARSTVIYLLYAAGFSLVVSLLLFTNATRFVALRVFLLTGAVLLMVTGLFSQCPLQS